VTSVAQFEPVLTITEGRPSWWKLGRQSWVVRCALLLIGGHLVYRAWVVYGAWFWGDDFAFISRMLNDGTSPSVAMHEYAGHIMPVPMYLTWLLNAVSPYNWLLFSTILFLMQAAAALGLLRLLVIMFGPRPGILPPLALFLFTIFSVPVSLWWAAGINQLPLQIVLFFGLAAQVTYLRTGLRRHALLATVWVAIGLLFYEKTLLVIGAYLVVTLCWFTSGSLKERILQVVTRYRFSALLSCGLGGAYLVVYVFIGLTFAPSRVSDSPIAPVAANLVARGWLTGVFGGPLRWGHISPTDPGGSATPSDLLVVVCAALLFLVLRELRRTRSRSMRALWLPGFFLACDVLLVTAGRASYVGAIIALDYRYQSEMAAVTVIALACATMSIRGAREIVEPRGPSELLDHPRRVALATVAVCVLGLVSSTQYTLHWQGANVPRGYFAALLHDLQRTDARVNAIDGRVPGDVMWAAGYPYNSHRYLLRQFEDSITFVEASTDGLSLIDQQGHVRPVGIPPTRSAVKRPTSANGCSHRITRDGATIPLEGPLAYGGWWLRIGYLSTARSPIQVSVGGETRRTEIQRGLHSLYVKAGQSTFQSLRISGLSGNVVLCTGDITAGRPEPVEPTP